jgi:ElaA protein
MPAAALPIHVAALDDLAPRQLYGLLQLRIEVFSLEQDIAYQDLDGKDGDPGTLLLWQEAEDGQVVSTIRLLEDGEERIIGRVVTAKAFRGRGLAAQLVQKGIELAAGHPVRISAQAHLAEWYSGFGFVAYGEGYFEEGIPHIGMRRPA